MKKYLLLACALCLGAVCITSCGDDDEPIKQQNNNNPGETEIVNQDVTPANDEWAPTKQQAYLEEVALEMNSIVQAEDFRHYIELASYVNDTYIDGYKWNAVGDWVDDILDGLMGEVVDTKIEKEEYGNNIWNYTYNTYKSTVLASNFNGHWTASNGRWLYEKANDLQFIFTNKAGQQCVLKVTTSGDEKRCHFFDVDDGEDDDVPVPTPNYSSCTFTEYENSMTMTCIVQGNYTEIQTATFDSNDNCIEFILSQTFVSSAIADAVWNDIQSDEDFDYTYSRQGNTITVNLTDEFKDFNREAFRYYFQVYKENFEKAYGSGTTNPAVYEHDITYDRTEYTIGVPQHIEVTLTEGGTTLVKQTLDIDLSGITNGEFNLSSSSLGFNSVTTLSNGYVFNTKNVKYSSSSTSATTTVEKNGRTLIVTTFSTGLSGIPNQILTGLYDMDDDDIEDLFAHTTTTNAAFSVDILGKVQVKGTISDAHQLIDYLDKADDNDKDEFTFKQAVANANKCYKANIYYNGGITKQAYMSLEPLSDKYYDWMTNSYNTKWEMEPTINFHNGTSYSFEEYFNEDAFKKLIDAIEDQGDNAEDMWD